MAEETITTEEVLKKFGEHLECTICFNLFKRPKILDCLHNFCFECLENYKVTQYPDSIKLPCPLCRRETVIPKDGISGLTSNFSMTALVEEYTHQEKLVKRQKSKVICEVCEEEDAVSRCSDCKEYLCCECQRAHQRAKKTKRHEIVTLDDLRSGKVTFKSKMRDEIPKCKKHTNQEVCFFCKTCKVLICAVCTALDHSMPTHIYEDIEAAEMSFRKDAKVLLTKAGEGMQRFLVAKDFIDDASQRLDEMLADALADVSRRADGDVARIRQQEDTLKKEVTTIGQQRAELIKTAQESHAENLKWAQHTLEMAKSVLDQSSRFQLLELKEKLVRNLTDVSEQHIPDPIHSMSPFLAFKPGPVKTDTPFGKLLLEEKWILKALFHGKARYGEDADRFKMAASIAAFTNGHMVVADFDEYKLGIFDPEGHFTCTFDAPDDQPEGKLHNPYDLAVTKEDKLVVIDKPVVKVFDASDAHQIKYLCSFTPVSAGADDVFVETDLSCIAVDKKSHIAVGDAARKIISVHEIDGSLISKVPAEMIDRRLAISNKEQLIFSNYQKAKLVSLDFDGQEVFCIDTIVDGMRKKPAGMCCSRYGDIYIVLHARDEHGTGEIHHYSAEGVHMGRIADSLCNPLGLTFTPNGDLAVADMLSVQVYQRD